MRFLPPLCLAMLGLLASCSNESYVDCVREVPVKSTRASSFDTGLLRAQTTYVMHGALTSKERRDRLGQYYYVTWYDAKPQEPSSLVFEYQLARTGSRVHQKQIAYPSPRSRGSKKAVISILGDEYLKQGPVLTWKLSLVVSGKTVSTRRSYLWRDDATTSGEHTPPATFDPIPAITGVNPASPTVAERATLPESSKEVVPTQAKELTGDEEDLVTDPSTDSTYQPGTVSGSAFVD